WAIVNAMAPAYASKLARQIRRTDVRAKKIDGSTLETYGMVIAGFQIQDKLERVRFFQETFLVVDTTEFPNQIIKELDAVGG
ncbi:hypothetical protein MMC31_000947, partial [Peltigera leucophlebia]|nr:hypothetical protein [Peltigera leucophlebia]